MAELKRDYPGREIYLDNNATTRSLGPVREAVLEGLDGLFGNPSSVHYAGERARNKIECAREALAQLLGVEPARIIFTSGATESNNIVLGSLKNARLSKPRVITTTIEHSSVLKSCQYLETQGVEVIYLEVDRAGCVAIEEFETSITPETTLVSVQWVNSETGVVQPVEQIARSCQERGVPFHTDAAQAVGKLKINLSSQPLNYCPTKCTTVASARYSAAGRKSNA